MNSNSQSSISSFANNGINVMTNSDSKGSFSSSHSSPRPLNMNDQLNGEWHSSNANSMTNSNTNLNGKNNSPPLPQSVNNMTIEKQLMGADAGLIEQSQSMNNMLNKNAFFGATTVSKQQQQSQSDGDDPNFASFTKAQQQNQYSSANGTNGTTLLSTVLNNGQRIRTASNTFPNNDLNPTLIEDQVKQFYSISG